MPDRNACWYLTGFAATMLGNSAMILVAGVWVKALTGDNGAAAAVSVCVFAPSLAAPFAGLLVDRVRRRRFLVTVDLAMAAAVLPLLLVRDASTVWLIYAVMLAYGTSLVVTDPAETGLFTDLFDAAARGRLNGAKMTVQEGAKLLAPPLGAALFAVAGGGVVAGLDAVTFAVAALTLLALRIPDRRPPRIPGASPWRELTAGLRHIFGAVTLRRPVLGAAAAMFIGGLVPGIQYGIADALHRPAAFVGVLVGVLGGGSIVGGLTAPWVLRRFGERVLTAAGMVNTVLATGLLGLPWLPAVLAGSALRGLGLPWIVVAVLTLTQNRTGPGLQGRVSAAVSVLLFAPVAPAGGLGAGLITLVDYRVLLAAIAAVNLAMVAYLSAPVRKGATEAVRTGR